MARAWKGWVEPARSIILKIGVEAASDITERKTSTVYKWLTPKECGGSGGRIPWADAEKLLQFSIENGIDLKADDFFLCLGRGS